MRIVQKYGGTSLANGELVRKAALRGVGLARQGHQVVMVVSAQGHTTDGLVEKAEAQTAQPPARELDALLSCGEQMSAALMAMTLADMSRDYAAAAVLLRQRLKLLRQMLAETEDPEEIWHIKRRIAELTPMLTQMNELAELTAHYYDRGYYRSEKYTL